MQVLDIFIGLVLIYFLYSLLTSIIVEMLSTWMGLRARHLKQGIDNLLNDRPINQNQNLSFCKKLLNHFEFLYYVIRRCDIRKIWETDFFRWIKDILLVENNSFKYTSAGKFYQLPEIRSLAKKGDHFWFSLRNTKPSYISKETYSKALVSMISQKGKGSTLWEMVQFSIKNNALHLEQSTAKKFNNLLIQANGKYENFIELVEQEYEEMMDRLNGWYKRKVGLFIFWIGFIICAISNVDSIRITKIIANNEEIRNELVELAEKKVNNAVIKKDSTQLKENLEKQYEKALIDINNVSNILGLGWQYQDVQGAPNFYQKGIQIVNKLCEKPISLLGILITALALSLGAQFWFDLLKKLVALRGAGKKPEDEADTKDTLSRPKKLSNDGNYPLTSDPYDLLISQERAKWEALPGFLGFNKVLVDKEQIIEVLIDTAFNKPQNKWKGDIKVNFTHTNKGILSCAYNGDSYLPGTLRQNTTKVMGTPSGIVKNRRTGRKALLTCGHFVRTTGGFFEKDTTTVSICTGNDWEEIGYVTNAVISCYADGGVIELDYENMDKLQINSISNIREANEADVHKKDFKLHKLSGIEEIQMVHKRTYFTFNNVYFNDTRHFELLVFTHKDNPKIQVSNKGDSGALITDNNKIAIGILVGGNKDTNDYRYSYAIKITDLFEILQLEPI